MSPSAHGRLVAIFANYGTGWDSDTFVNFRWEIYGGDRSPGGAIRSGEWNGYQKTSRNLPRRPTKQIRIFAGTCDKTDRGLFRFSYEGIPRTVVERVSGDENCARFAGVICGRLTDNDTIDLRVAEGDDIGAIQWKAILEPVDY